MSVGLALATAAFVSIPVGLHCGPVRAQTVRRVPARTPLPRRTEPRVPTPAPGFVVPGTNTPIIISGYVHHLDSSIGEDAGLGVRVIPGDPYLLKFPKRVPIIGVRGEVMLNSGAWWHTLGVNFARGSERSSASEPNGGDPIGYVPGDPNLGAGVNFGNTGSSASGDVSLTEVGLSYKAMRPFNLQNGFAWGWGPTPEEEESRKALGLEARYSYRGLDYAGHLQRDADPNNVFADVDHDLRTHRFTFGPAIYGERMLGSGWFLHGKADAQAGFMRSTLDSREITCFGCGGVSNASAYGDSKTSLAWSARAQAGIGYQWTPKLKLVIGAEAWIGNRHILDTRRNPTDEGTGIATSTETDYGVFGRIVYTSDARLKRDVMEVGRRADGIALYRYRYLWSDAEYVGVMAHEAAAVVPEAVVRGSDSYLRVDYGKLGMRLMTWDEWRGPSYAEVASAVR
ncbi:MAG: tail fiber domain-containing protein [Xanthobacteraceae bacterium]